MTVCQIQWLRRLFTSPGGLLWTSIEFRTMTSNYMKRNVIEKNVWLTMNSNFWSRVGWFTNDFYKWCSHECKSLGNCPTDDQKNVIHRAANLWNIISIFCWKIFRILSYFSVSLNLFLTRLKTFIRQLPIYSGGTHPLPVETLVDSFSTTGTGSEARKRVTTTCGREKMECFGD